MVGTPPAGPPADRTIEVAPERLPGWLGRFSAAHGQPEARPEGADLVLAFPDGSAVRLVDRWGGAAPADPAGWIAAQGRDRRVGLLLVRRTAHAVGIATGPALDAHHVDTHYVQGRTKAGGWSQQRYARRRSNQTDQALRSAADDAARVLLPDAATLDGLVCGGDAREVARVLADPRLRALAERRTLHPVYPVPDPRLVVLRDLAVTLRAVPVQITDPPPAPQ